MVNILDLQFLIQGGGSAHDIFRGSGFIYKEYITSPFTSIVNFRHFHSFLASYSKIPTLYFYFERLLPGPIDTLNPGRNLNKIVQTDETKSSEL